MGGDISIPVGGGNKLRVSWNDDGNNKIDASERESVKVEIRGQSGNLIATPIDPNDTASRLSIKLFQAIDKAEGRLMGSDDHNTATPNQITKEELGIAAGTFQEVADTMVNQEGQSVDIQTVIADFNAPDSSGDGAGEGGDIESDMLRIEGTPDDRRFQAFMDFFNLNQFNPTIAERAYNRLSGDAIPRLRGNLQILDAIFKGYLANNQFEDALRIAEVMNGESKKEALIRLVEAARNSGKQIDRQLAARAVRVLTSTFPGQLDAQNIKVEEPEEYARAVEYEAQIPDELWEIRSRALQRNAQNPAEWDPKEKITEADRTTLTSFINGPTRSEVDKAIARLVLAECLWATAMMLNEKWEAPGGKADQTLTIIIKDKEEKLKLEERKKAAVEAFITAAKHCRAAGRALITAPNLARKANTLTGKMAKLFYDKGIAVKAKKGQDRTAQRITLALACFIDRGSKLDFEVQEGRVERNYDSNRAKIMLSNFVPNRSSGNLELGRDNENKFEDPLGLMGTTLPPPPPARGSSPTVARRRPTPAVPASLSAASPNPAPAAPAPATPAAHKINDLLRRAAPKP